MSRRASDMTQAEVRRYLAGARQAGLKEVEIVRGGTVIRFKLSPSSTEPPIEQPEEIVL